MDMYILNGVGFNFMPYSLAALVLLEVEKVLLQMLIVQIKGPNNYSN